MDAQQENLQLKIEVEALNKHLQESWDYIFYLEQELGISRTDSSDPKGTQYQKPTVIPAPPKNRQAPEPVSENTSPDSQEKEDDNPGPDTSQSPGPSPAIRAKVLKNARSSPALPVKKSKADSPKAVKAPSAEGKFNTVANRPKKATLGSGDPTSRASLPNIHINVPLDEAGYRRKVLEEILSTEEAYVKNLSLVIGTFVQPLKRVQDTDEKLLSKQEIEQIFSNITEIMDIHLELLHEFHTRAKTWEGADPEKMMIADLFLEYAPRIVKIYAKYSQSRPVATKVLMKCSRRSHFESFLQEMKAVCDSLTLEALLITPCQRIPRYELLLLDLKKHTQKTHPDYENIEKCSHALKEVGNAMNTALEEFHMREKAAQVASLFYDTGLKELLNGDKLANGVRRFIKQGTLTKICRKTQKKREFFLFDDIIVYGTPDIAGKYTAHNLLHLEKCRVLSEEGKAELKMQFRIDSDKKSVVLLAASEKEKQDWVNTLNITLSKRLENSELGDSTFAPVWKPDSQSKACDLCSKSFSFTFRRHHCRLCGLVVCENCSKSRVNLPHIDAKAKSRVCDKCAKGFKK